MRDGDYSVRILWVLKELGIGGAERMLLELLPYFSDDLRFFPTFVSRTGDDLVPHYRGVGLRPYSLGAAGNWDLRWMVGLRRLVRRLDPSIVHLHNPLPGSGGRLALAGQGIPIVYTEHSVWMSHHPLSRWANSSTLWMSDVVVAASDAVLQSITSHPLGRLVKGRSRLILNGIDSDKVRTDAEADYSSARHTVGSAPSYGSVSHLRHRKGVDVLLRAAPLIRSIVPGVRGYVAGGGEDAARMGRIKSAVGADDVEFLGVRSDARGLMRCFDVFVVPSRSEGLPLALLEAMALERPIVATAVGGIPDVLSHEEDALLVPPDDPQALGFAVARLLTDHALATRLGARAQERLDTRHSAAATAGQYESLYRTLASGSSLNT
jgi:glycosyltransferase involved in cell wall biosynthesis